MAGIGVVGAGAWTGVYVGTDVVAGVYHRMQHCGVHDAAMHVRGSTPRSTVGAVLTARSMVLLLRPFCAAFTHEMPCAAQAFTKALHNYYIAY